LRLPGAGFVGVALAVSACAPQVDDMRMGVSRSPREPTCTLDVVNATDVGTITKYDQVGMVRLSREEAGTDPMAPAAREIVRPRACAMGGEAISIVMSGDVMNRTGIGSTAFAAYIVWAKKPAAGAAPQKF
jgi:hypothetical protein